MPLNGEHFLDTDSHLVMWKHEHKFEPHSGVCLECLGMSKCLTLQVCEAIRLYYHKVAVVFSGRAGFHVHVLDFDYLDWTLYKQSEPLWCHSASRFKFTKSLKLQTYAFDRVHFTVLVDPMRIVTVPNTLNGQTGLRCLYIGEGKDLERLTIMELVKKASCLNGLNGYPESLDSFREKAVMRQ